MRFHQICRVCTWQTAKRTHLGTGAAYKTIDCWQNIAKFANSVFLIFKVACDENILLSFSEFDNQDKLWPHVLLVIFCAGSLVATISSHTHLLKHVGRCRSYHWPLSWSLPFFLKEMFKTLDTNGSGKIELNILRVSNLYLRFIYYLVKSSISMSICG